MHRIVKQRLLAAPLSMLVVGLVALLSVSLSSAPVFAASPTHGVFELKLGGYYPSIDDEFGGTGPFQTFFGDNQMLMGEFSIDFYLLEGIGTLGLGFHAGYSSKTASVLDRNDMDSELPDSTTFRVIPLRASLVYRYDYSALHHNIPLVPVLKAGLDYHLWNIDGADGETAFSNDRSGSGARTGWHASVALHFLLDVIDGSSAAAFDLNWGINHSYLFAEYQVSKIDGFDSPGFDLSDNQWFFGLAFEY